jgi:hypothetical protein
MMGINCTFPTFFCETVTLSPVERYTVKDLLILKPRATQGFRDSEYRHGSKISSSKVYNTSLVCVLCSPSVGCARMFRKNACLLATIKYSHYFHNYGLNIKKCYIFKNILNTFLLYFLFKNNIYYRTFASKNCVDILTQK